MLRDRTPKIVIFALKWCKAQEKWLNHVYDNWIWIYASKKERLNATRRLLGLDKNPRKFIFEDTILWDNFSEEEEKQWKTIVGWVSWFQSCYAYIENTYNISKKVGKSIEDTKLEIMFNYLTAFCPTPEDNAKKRKRKNEYVNKLCDFLIDCFENRI